VISVGAITKRANDERMPAQTIERDYVLAHVCSEVGAAAEQRLIFKGGTLLRFCYFNSYRHSADLDFSVGAGFSRGQALELVGEAVTACRKRLELPHIELTLEDGNTSWITYVGPLRSQQRKLKLDISDSELVESHKRLGLFPLWPDLPEGAAIEGYTLGEVGAEKIRSVTQRSQCRDLFDLHELLEGAYIDPLEVWDLYRRKVTHDIGRGNQRVPPGRWADAFENRLVSYRARWEREMGNYLADVPPFDGIERRIRRHLVALIDAARRLGD
jgi:predicted nucleotidyltransferase component of viral defense system